MPEDFELRSRAANALAEILEIRRNPSKSHADAIEKLLEYLAMEQKLHCTESHYGECL